MKADYLINNLIDVQRGFFHFQLFKNLSKEKKTLSTVTGFELGPFDCRSNQKTWARTPAHSKASLFPQNDF